MQKQSIIITSKRTAKPAAATVAPMMPSTGNADGGTDAVIEYYSTSYKWSQIDIIYKLLYHWQGSCGSG